MLFPDHLVVVRGGGDLASGAVARLVAAGFPVVVLELGKPLAIRQRVAFASAVTSGEATVDGIEAIRVESADAAWQVASTGKVAVLIEPEMPDLPVDPAVVVDGRMAKRNLGSSVEDAPLVIGLGPGFTAGEDCDAVIETMRGHRLGRVIWEGTAQPDTGVPGRLGGADAERVVRAPTAGPVSWSVEIGDLVEAGAELGEVGGHVVAATIGGVVRGLIGEGHPAAEGLKIGDIDPRGDRAACFEISDKARLVGAGVLEAVLIHLGREQS